MRRFAKSVKGSFPSAGSNPVLSAFRISSVDCDALTDVMRSAWFESLRRYCEQSCDHAAPMHPW